MVGLGANGEMQVGCWLTGGWLLWEGLIDELVVITPPEKRSGRGLKTVHTRECAEMNLE